MQKCHAKLYISDKFIRYDKSRVCSLPMNLNTHQLYLLQQLGESFTIWSAINTEGKSLLMKSSPDHLLYLFKHTN